MNNGIVQALYKTFVRRGFATLRFNFRGVGASGGKHDEGDGEVDDVNAAIEWAKWKHPGRKLLVGGFSFGAWVASRAACERADVDAVFLIGTPVNKYDFSYLKSCEKPMLFVHGTQDEHGDVHKLEKLVPSVRNAESVIITGADHFFTKQLEVMEETIRAWAEELLDV